MTPHEVHVYKQAIIQIEKYYLELQVYFAEQAESDEAPLSWPDDEAPCPRCGSESEIVGIGANFQNECIVCGYTW